MEKIVRVIFVALLLDILSFTIILPLFPRLMDHYRQQFKRGQDPFFGICMSYIHSFKHFIGAKGDRLDIVLFGGAMGSLFSLLQFMVSPYIGQLSDRYGRKRTLLWTMTGNVLSAFLWVFSGQFYLFVLARVVAGLSEGNVQLSIAMISDVTTTETRSKGLALVGIAFALGFTFGPALGAYFSSIDIAKMMPQIASKFGLNSFSASAAVCLLLLVLETVYIQLYVKETKPKESPSKKKSIRKSKSAKERLVLGTSVHLLAMSHFLYLFFFSASEFTLTFLTFDRFKFSNMQQGYLLGMIGIMSSLIQGGYVRRMAHKIGEKHIILQGVIACFVSLLSFAFVGTTYDPFYTPTHTSMFSAVFPSPLMWVASLGFAFASGTVVNGLTSLTSLFSGIEFAEENKGAVLGHFRSYGQLGRALGPIVGCTIYWLTGSLTSYLVCASGIIMAYLLVTFIQSPKLKSK